MIPVLFVCLLHFCNGQGLDDACFTLNFDSPIYACEDNDIPPFVNTNEIEVVRCNETTAYMHGDIVLLQDLSDAILQIVVSKEQYGKFEVVFTHDICDLCTELGDEESQYRKYLKYFGFPSQCPIEAGIYKIHDWFLDMEEIEVASQHEGRYQAQMNIYTLTGENCQQDRELKCEMMMDLIVEPCE